MPRAASADVFETSYSAYLRTTARIRSVLIVSPDPELRTLIESTVAEFDVEISFADVVADAHAAAENGSQVDLVILDPLATRRAYFARENVSLQPFSRVAALLLDPSRRVPFGVDFALDDVRSLRQLLESSAAPQAGLWLERCG